MPRARTRAALALLAAFALAACAGLPVERTSGAPSLYERGIDRFQRGDYYQSIKIFEELIRDYPGSELIDDGIYHLGRSYLENDDYALAVTEFDRLATDYPESPYVPEADFYTGESYFRQRRSPQYDPEMTEQALSRYRRFIRLHPDHALRAEAEKRIQVCREWLAEKDIIAARQYEKLGFAESACIYYKKVVGEYADTKWSPVAEKKLRELRCP